MRGITSCCVSSRLGLRHNCVNSLLSISLAEPSSRGYDLSHISAIGEPRAALSLKSAAHRRDSSARAADPEALAGAVSEVGARGEVGRNGFSIETSEGAVR